MDSCSASACRFQSALIDGIVGLSHGPETRAQGLGAARASASFFESCVEVSKRLEQEELVFAFGDKKGWCQGTVILAAISEGLGP